MVKYSVTILFTDKYLKKGCKDITYETTTYELDELRAFLYRMYFRTAQLREKFYSATIKQGNKVVGDVFVTRIGQGPGSLKYVFAGPNFNIRSPLYILDKKYGTIIGERL